MTALSLIFMILLLLIYFFLAFFSSLLAPVNLLVRAWVDNNRDLRLRPLMILTHRFNDILSLSVQLIVLSLLLSLIWGDWRRAMVLLSAMFVLTTVVGASKRLTSIDRPPQLISHVIMTTGSYPSGHSASSLMFALLVPTMLAPYLALPILIAVAVFLFLIALMTAYGRLYLDVHWLTDIVGGWALSGAIYLFCRQFI